MDGWQWWHLVVGSTSRLPFPASIPGLCNLKLGVAIAVTLNAIVKESLRFQILRFDPEFLALFCIFLYQTSGHINSYGDGQECAPFIQPRGWSPHQAVISGIATLFHAWTFRTSALMYHQKDRSTRPFFLTSQLWCVTRNMDKPALSFWPVSFGVSPETWINPPFLSDQSALVCHQKHG